MQSVTVVAAELGVNTIEGGVTVGLGLLDTVWEIDISVGLVCVRAVSSAEANSRKRAQSQD